MGHTPGACTGRHRGSVLQGVPWLFQHGRSREIAVSLKWGNLPHIKYHVQRHAQQQKVVAQICATTVFTGASTCPYM